jgi:hypothetical protein
MRLPRNQEQAYPLSVHIHEDAEAVQQKHGVFVWYVRANEDSYFTNNSCSGIINVVRQLASSILI